MCKVGHKFSDGNKFFEKNKKPVDISGIWLFGTAMFVVMAVAIYAFQKCSPFRFYRGTDSWGNVCGGDSNTRTAVENLPGSGQIKLESAYVWLAGMPLMTATSVSKDLTQCYSNGAVATILSTARICVKECPSGDSNHYNSVDCLSILRRSNYERYATALSLCQHLSNVSKMCLPEDGSNLLNVSYVSVLGRCVEAKQLLYGLVIIPDYVDYYHYFTHSLLVSLDAIACSLFLGIFLSLLTLILLTKFPKFAFKCCFTLCPLICAFCFIYHLVRFAVSFSSFRNLSNGTVNSAENEVLLSIFSLLLTFAGCVLCITRAWAHLETAVGATCLITTASKCLRMLPKLFSQALWTLFGVAASLSFFLSIAIHSANCYYGAVSDDGVTVKYLPLISQEVVTIAHMCVAGMAVWSVCSLVTAQKAIVAGAVREWYFCKNRSKLHHPITKASMNLLRYNLGSILLCAFGGTISHYLMCLCSRLHFCRSNKVDGELSRKCEVNSKRQNTDAFIGYFSPYSAVAVGVYGHVRCSSLCPDCSQSSVALQQRGSAFQIKNVQSSGSPKSELNKAFLNLRMFAGAARWCMDAFRISFVCVSFSAFVAASATKVLYLKMIVVLVTLLASLFACDVCLCVFSAVTDAVSECVYIDLNVRDKGEKVFYGSRELLYRVAGYKLRETDTYSGLLRFQKRKLQAEFQERQIKENQIRDEEARKNRRRASSEKAKISKWRGGMLQTILDGRIRHSLAFRPNFASRNPSAMFNSQAVKSELANTRLSSVGSAFSSMQWKRHEADPATCSSEVSHEFVESDIFAKHKNLINAAHIFSSGAGISKPTAIDNHHEKLELNDIETIKDENIFVYHKSNSEQEAKEKWKGPLVKGKFGLKQKANILKRGTTAKHTFEKLSKKGENEAFSKQKYKDDKVWEEDFW